MGQRRRRGPSSSPPTPEAAAGGGGGSGDGGGTAAEYEMQRLARIRENRARMEALGLPHIASSIFCAAASSSDGNGTRIKGKKRADCVEDDDEYQPSDHDDEEEDRSDDGEEENDSRSKFQGKKKITSKQVKSHKKLLLDRKPREFDDFIDDDAALQQAIALSLGGPLHSSALHSGLTLNPDSIMAESGPSIKKDRANMHGASGKKNKITTKRRVQLTEDEVVAYFFSFDEVGKGYVTVRDLEKMAIAHDFSWTENEIYNMIHCFDSDRDGKLNLNDFRTIASRCNMIQGERDS